MATLSTFTRTIDTAFTQTWYKIQREAADNVLLSTVVWAMLKMKGCFKPQRGGNDISRTIYYQLPTPIEVVKGDVMGEGETESHMAAFWTFRMLSQHIQRSLADDAANAGEFQIRSYVADRLKAANDAIGQRYETDLNRAAVTDETGKNIQGLNDLIPTVADRTTGTYGKIARPASFTSGAAGAPDVAATGNTFWAPRYQALRLPYEVYLVSDMKSFFNTVGNQQENPDVILTDQGLYETYEEFGLDAVQTLASQKLLDLGFTNLQYKGATLAWTPNITANTMKFLNTKWIDVVYDPGMWFDMTNWKDIPRQMERIAHILCRMNIVSSQLRRHGLLYTA